MPRNDITPNLLKELYLKKLLSKKEIASFLKCNIITIHKKMKKFGIRARPIAKAVKIAMRKQIIKILKSKLENLYLKKKLAISEIAKKLDYDRSIIKRELERHGIPLRTQNEVISLRRKKERIKKMALKTFYYKDRLTQEQISKKLGKSREHISILMKEYGLKTRNRSETSTRYPKFDFSDNLEEKAYLIGFRTGDLSANLSSNKKLITVGTTSTKPEQIKLFKDLFRKYGHIWVSKKRKDGNRVFVVRLNCTFNFLLPKQDNIPKWIRENKDYFLSFLAGYTDAEGCIHIDKNNVSRFQLASYDKNILKQIHKQLIKIGIECKSPRISVQKGHIKSNGLVYRNDHWRFTINRKSSLLPVLRFLKLRLKHRKKLNDLLKAEQNIIKRNQEALSEKIS